MADRSRDSVTVFAKDASGDVAPARSIKGSQTTIDQPYAIAADDNWIYVGNWNNGSVAVFPIAATGDVAPTRLIQGTSTALNHPQGIAVDTNWIYVADYNNCIAVFPIGGTGDIAPSRKIQGGGTTLSNPWGVAVDTDWIFVANNSGKNIPVFQISATGNVVPTRSIQGDLTFLYGPIGITIDARVVCPRSISPTNRSHGPGAETGTVDVTTLTGCNWTAASNNAWITLTSGANGSGNGTVGYSVSPNGSASPRTGTLTIAGQTFTVNQDGAPASSITLTSPSDQTFFNSCSLFSLPTFAWNGTEPFKSYEIQFSSNDTFDSISAKVKTSATEVRLSSTTWKKVLLIRGTAGGAVYWRVVGTRADRTPAPSNVCSILIEGAHGVDSPQISPTGKGSLPTLSWTNHCNKKFKVWFGNDISFSKKKSFSFNLKDLSETFTKGLTSSQWGSIRKLVGDSDDSPITWYVESWDGLGRHATTEVMNFVLTD